MVKAVGFGLDVEVLKSDVGDGAELQLFGEEHRTAHVAFTTRGAATEVLEVLDECTYEHRAVGTQSGSLGWERRLVVCSCLDNRR